MAERIGGQSLEPYLNPSSIQRENNRKKFPRGVQRLPDLGGSGDINILSEHQKSQQQEFLRVFENLTAVNFVATELLKRYEETFPEHREDIKEMIDFALKPSIYSFLADISTWLKSPEKLKRANGHFREIIELIYSEFRFGGWFPDAYREYKEKVRTPNDVRLFNRYIKRGDKLIDIGCGSGHLAEALFTEGYDVYLTDIEDYRKQTIKEKHKIPFEKMKSSTEIGFSNQVFDAGFLVHVLHHNIEEHLPTFIEQISKIIKKGGKLIILEDLIGPFSGILGFDELREIQPVFLSYSSMDREDQKAGCLITDIVANLVAAGKWQMEVPGNFKSLGEWADIFSPYFSHVETTLLGFDPKRLHPSCGGLIVCTK